MISQSFYHLTGHLLCELFIQCRHHTISYIVTRFDPSTEQSASGSGVELETIHQALLRFTGSHAMWFVNLLDDRATLRMMLSAANCRHVPQDRLQSLKLLGALCALMMIHERAPEPLDPGIFQFFFNNCNLHSLHRDFIGDWHPSLRQTLDDWHAAGPKGSIDQFRSFFASYMDQDV